MMLIASGSLWSVLRQLSSLSLRHRSISTCRVMSLARETMATTLPSLTMGTPLTSANLFCPSLVKKR